MHDIIFEQLSDNFIHPSTIRALLSSIYDPSIVILTFLIFSLALTIFSPTYLVFLIALFYILWILTKYKYKFVLLVVQNVKFITRDMNLSFKNKPTHNSCFVAENSHKEHIFLRNVFAKCTKSLLSRLQTSETYYIPNGSYEPQTQSHQSRLNVDHSNMTKLKNFNTNHMSYHVCEKN